MTTGFYFRFFREASQVPKPSFTKVHISKIKMWVDLARVFVKKYKFDVKAASQNE